MIKRIFIVVVCCLFSTLIKAQFGQIGPVGHAQWALTSKKVSDCEYDLIFTVTLDKNWHTFSIVKIKGAEQEVFPTQITFKPNAGYTLVGNLTETKPTPEYDETIKKTVLLHYKKVVFTQRVKLTASGNTKISGRYEYQVCNTSCETPPYEKFDFDLQGTAACKK